MAAADAVEFMTGLEFRLLSDACAERVDDLVGRLAEESGDLLRGLSRSCELAYGLPVACGQSGWLADGGRLAVSGLLWLLWRILLLSCLRSFIAALKSDCFFGVTT